MTAAEPGWYITVIRGLDTDEPLVREFIYGPGPRREAERLADEWAYRETLDWCYGTVKVV